MNELMIEMYQDGTLDLRDPVVKQPSVRMKYEVIYYNRGCPNPITTYQDAYTSEQAKLLVRRRPHLHVTKIISSRIHSKLSS